MSSPSPIFYQWVVIMAPSNMCAVIPRASLPLKALRCSKRKSWRASQYCRTMHQNTRSDHQTILKAGSRPLVPSTKRWIISPIRPVACGIRSIFIQTENTPNADVSNNLWHHHGPGAERLKALKFLPNHPILPENLSSPFLEYLSPRSTLAPPHTSPLAARLMNIDGITSVFYGPDFITVTKAADANWAHVKPEVFSLITEAVTSGEQIVNSGGWGWHRISRLRQWKRLAETPWSLPDVRLKHCDAEEWNWEHADALRAYTYFPFNTK